ncbi:MAG TPA: hypothetical protein VHN14_03890 [Kofleriaceae bacterium]|nr:hypothetical protein [Kofleriaceae bacterium]
MESILHAFHVPAELLPQVSHLPAELGRRVRELILRGDAEPGYRLFEIILGGQLAHAFKKLPGDAAYSNPMDTMVACRDKLLAFMTTHH